MRANVGTVSVQCLGGYVAESTTVVRVACKPPPPLYPTTPPFLPIAVSPTVPTAPPQMPPGLSGRCTSPLFRPPHVYAFHTPHLSVGVVVRSILQFVALASLCKCASVQVCPFDASPSHIPRVGAPVGWSVAVGAMKLQLQLQLQLPLPLQYHYHYYIYTQLLMVLYRCLMWIQTFLSWTLSTALSSTFQRRPGSIVSLTRWATRVSASLSRTISLPWISTSTIG